MSAALRSRVAVLTVPGSNCDADLRHAVALFGMEPVAVWHKESTLPNVDAVLLPGGFSYGDYLRCGAIARFSPIMEAVRAFAAAGGPVLGICNGFQILTECGLLPGVLLRNRGLKFLCQDVELTVEGRATPFTRGVGGPLGLARSISLRAVAGHRAVAGRTWRGAGCASGRGREVGMGAVGAGPHGEECFDTRSLRLRHR